MWHTKHLGLGLGFGCVCVYARRGYKNSSSSSQLSYQSPSRRYPHTHTFSLIILAGARHRRSFLYLGRWVRGGGGQIRRHRFFVLESSLNSRDKWGDNSEKIFTNYNFKPSGLTSPSLIPFHFNFGTWSSSKFFSMYSLCTDPLVPPTNVKSFTFHSRPMSLSTSVSVCVLLCFIEPIVGGMGIVCFLCVCVCVCLLPPPARV